MKSMLETILDGSGVMFRLFLAAICYKVSPDMTILMCIFYLINFGFSAYYIHLREKEDKEFIEMAQEAIKKASEEYERNKTDVK